MLKTRTIEARKRETERIERIIKRLQKSGLIDNSLTNDIDIDSDDHNWIQHNNDTINCVDDTGRVLVNVGHDETELDIYLSQTIAEKIMAHQIGGIRFLYDNIIESVASLQSNDGYGCIISHAMGLGKTLQVIALVDIFMKVKIKSKALIVVPINVLNNWMNEFDKWVPVINRPFKVFLIDKLKTRKLIKSITDWQTGGGVLLIGYEMYLRLTQKPEISDNQLKNSDIFAAQLVDPGPDIVVCDEGHRIKNDETDISKAIKKIRTMRRIILTGYPLQNRLKEFYCMIDFVRPHYLDVEDEFNRSFALPITKGQCKDSKDFDKKLMRYRSHVLNQLLKGFFQRRTEEVLKSALPQKQEFVIFCKLSAKQKKLLNAFHKQIAANRTKRNNLFKTFVITSKILSHPDIIYDIVERGGIPQHSEEDCESESSSYLWAKNQFSNYEKQVLSNSNKMVILFDIINESVAKGDRLLIFSQWLFTLDLIETLLESRNVLQFDYKWKKNTNYYRLDGKTKTKKRDELIKSFNSENNKTVHLFLISTKAGGLGINLTGANRIVIVDASWNPCNDAQASCRIFRPGQSKQCFIYRLIADNSLEKRLFNLQTYKRGMSNRVVDQQNIGLKLNRDEVHTLLDQLDEDLPQDQHIYDLDEQKLNELNDSVLTNVCQKCKSCLTCPPSHLQTFDFEEMEELALTSAQKKEAMISYRNEINKN